MAECVAGIPGPAIETACGSGHMLSLHHHRYDPDHLLLGIELSLRMVAITGDRLESRTEVVAGDMRLGSSQI